jgi:hypothetical protein
MLAAGIGQFDPKADDAPEPTKKLPADFEKDTPT